MFVYMKTENLLLVNMSLLPLGIDYSNLPIFIYVKIETSYQLPCTMVASLLHRNFLSVTMHNGCVGTLNQGYPLLQYEGTVPVRQSLAAR
jgi:hypothetical protein